LSDTSFGALPTTIGTMPHRAPGQACEVISRFLKDIPAWPQLPLRSPEENMYVQFSEGFPGLEKRDGGIVIGRTPGFDEAINTLYADYFDNRFVNYPVSRGHAAGLYHCMEQGAAGLKAIKGQVTGPVTWGLTVKDTGGRSILYDDLLGDAVPRFLKLKAAWQEAVLRGLSTRTIIFVDEPYLTAYGSAATMSLSPEKVVALLNEVFSGIKGIKGLHCCGNTDWGVLLGSRCDILSFDAYNFAGSLGLYADAVKGFLTRGGAVAWGIVPNTAEGLKSESNASLRDRLEEAMAPFTRGTGGFAIRDLVAQSLITPSCGLAGLSEEAVPDCLSLLTQLSDRMRAKYS
jgi:methionine synthase II (cobalamin-independent)